jgi:hypothetical protein
MSGFILQRDIDGIDVGDRLLVAGVMGALEHLEIQQRLGGKLQLFENRSFQRGGAVIQRQFYVGKAQHKCSYTDRFPPVPVPHS